MQDDVIAQFLKIRSEGKTIGWFPPAFTDELWYSVCARYKDSFRYSNSTVLEDLTGLRNTGYSANLPGSLGTIVGALPTSWGYKVDSIIDKHTLLPTYAPFMQPGKALCMRSLMSADRNKRVEAAAGIIAGRLPAMASPRLCTTCVEQDRQRHNECYWHRAHQVYGVEMCHLHDIPLMIWDKHKSWSEIRSRFVTAEQALDEGTFIPLELPIEWQPYLLKVALDVHWLLGEHSLATDKESVLQEYRKMLGLRRLLPSTGYAHTLRLQAAIEEFYPPNLLTYLKCQIDESKQANWLTMLIAPNRKLQGPLLHLLLIQFLGHSAQTFFHETENRSFFGRGPWPCLNPAADHYSQLTIASCAIEWTHRRLKDGSFMLSPRGVFTCKCGMVYTRLGPDTDPGDAYRYTRIREFGGLWEKYFVSAWSDKSRERQAVANELGVNLTTAYEYAHRMGLYDRKPRRNPQATRTRDTIGGSSHPIGVQETVQRAKNACLAAMQATSTPGISMLRKTMWKAFAILRKHDPTWLAEQWPSERRGCRKGAPGNSPVNWQARDEQIAREVSEAAMRLRTQAGMPVRITKTIIAKQIKALYLLNPSYLHRLPLSREALAKEVETVEDCTLRRIQWTVEQYLAEDIHPSRWALTQRAHVDFSLQKNSETVIIAIANAVQLLA